VGPEKSGRLPSRELRHALAFALPYWRSLALVLGLSLLSTLLALFIPWLSRILVDGALLGRDAGVLVRTLLAFAALTLGSFALNVVSGLRYTRVSADILFDMRRALFERLQHLSPRFYAGVPLGQIVARINGDIGEIQRVVAEVALAWVGNVLFLVGTAVILVQLDPVLFLVSLAMLPAALWALARYRKRLDGAVAAVRDRSADVGSFLIESLLGMKLVVGMNAQQREVGRFKTRNDAFIDALMRMRRLTYLAGGLPGLFLTIGSGLVFYVGGTRVIDGVITMGTLVAFVAYQVRLLGPIQALMGLVAGLTTAGVSLRRVHEILDAPLDVVEHPDAVPLPVVRGHVTLDAVTFGFGRGAAVLEKATLEIRPGERVALVGKSGEGKSTIADLLARLQDPHGGRVLLDGVDLRAARLADVRRHVVVVDQEPFLFNATLAENVRYARPDASDDQVLEALANAGLAELVARLPAGADTPVGERGRALSAGERQRVAIARAFLADPAVLVLDEATGALDPATEADVISGYEAVMRGRTTVLITHRAELARTADRVLVLDGGKIVHEATADALGSNGQGFRELFRAAASEMAGSGAVAPSGSSHGVSPT
jgi:ATP-binding cassette, subfamily B, bacterial